MAKIYKFLDIYKKSPIFYSFLIKTGVVRVTTYVTRDCPRVLS